MNVKSKEYIDEVIDTNIKKIKKNVDCKKYDKALQIAESSFKKIPSISYSNNYESIWNLVKSIINIPKGRNYALTMLTEIDKDEGLSKEAKLYITEKLKLLYMMNENYAKASEYAIKTIKFSRDVNDICCEVKSRIELGVIYINMGGYEVAINVIEDALKIKIKDKKDDSKMKIYGYINLAEINIELENYDKAKEICSLIPKYKDYFSDEDYGDIEISKDIVETKIYIYENNLNMAKDSLSQIGLLMKRDKYEYIADKDLEYLLVQAKYSWKTKDYDKSEDLYNEALKLCKTRNKDTYIKPILSDLLKLSIENKDEYLKGKYYNEILEVTKQQEKARNKDYSFYIMNYMKNEVDTINNLKKVKIFYGIMLIVIVSIIIISNIVYKKIKYRTTHDDLTKVFNRYLLDKNYKLMLRKNKDFAAIMIDIDNFKNINDTYGHGFGDTALIKMCKVVKAILNKNSDLYRYGGEEFAVLIKYGTKAEVFEISEKIRYYVEAMLLENDVKVTVSMGIAFSSIERELTIQRADENLYKAKSTGKNKVVM